jgi:hypothetical protein
MLAPGAAFIATPQVWWIVAAAAVTVSQFLIATAWTDARFGTIANVIVLACAAYAFAAEGPMGLRSEYRREVRDHTPAADRPLVVTEADLEPLPAPVQRYLRATAGD